MKAIFISLLLIGFSAQINAQDGNLSFGPKAGLNISKFTGDAEDQKMKTGFHVGGFVDYKINESFSVRPELLYSMVGSREKYDNPDVGYEEYTGKYSYLTLPIMARYHFSAVPGLNVAAGPYVGFLLSAKVKAESDGLPSAEMDVKDQTKKVDVGIGVGAAYEFYQGLFAELRGNFGLTNISDVDGSDSKVKNLVLQISVGYRFN